MLDGEFLQRFKFFHKALGVVAHPLVVLTLGLHVVPFLRIDQDNNECHNYCTPPSAGGLVIC